MLCGMLVLGIEQSTPRGSVALLDGDDCVAEASWIETRKREQRLFRELPALLKSAGRPIEAVERIAVGLGPGSFSGVRIAVSAACAMALPDHTPVTGIGSAEALACRAPDDGPPCTAVIGDARRNRSWVAAWERGPRGPTAQCVLPLQLAEPDALPFLLPETCLVLSPDHDRLTELLAGLAASGRTVEPGNAFPSAVGVARLAAAGGGVTAPPLTPPAPLYLHPAARTAPQGPGYCQKAV